MRALAEERDYWAEVTARALGFAQGETQMIVVFRQQFTRVPGVQPAEQHQDRGAAVLMTAGQRGFGFAAGAVV